MDLLVLIRVAQSLDVAFRGAIVRAFRQDSAHRFRLTAEREVDPPSVLFALTPEEPWVGRPASRREGPPFPPEPFAALLAKDLPGRIVEGIALQGFDRSLRVRFADGGALVAELAGPGTNLILLDAAGATITAASPPRSSAARVAPGKPYRPPPYPPGRLVPDPADPEAIDRAIATDLAAGDSVEPAIRRRIFGIGAVAAGLVAEEAASRGEPPARILADRLLALRSGGLDPVVEVDPARLLPWPPFGRSESEFRKADDPARTAALWYEEAERARRRLARLAGLRAILLRETERAEAGARRAREDAARFEDPDRWRRFGEALLAGLSVARREGDEAVVPDPYDEAGGTIRVPAPGDRTLQEAAEGHFRHARRAERGRARAEARAKALEGRRGRLDRILQGTETADALSEAMRNEGIPVELSGPVPKRRRSSLPAIPRLEGVRVATSRDGWTILVGKSGRENDRLTFKIAGPEDFWLHALGAPGAHVVIRNPGGARRPPKATLEEAAAAAAWYSDAKGHASADVQWTRRKYVRKARGAPKGTVLLKKSETVRVRPAPLPG